MKKNKNLCSTNTRPVQLEHLPEYSKDSQGTSESLREGVQEVFMSFCSLWERRQVCNCPDEQLSVVQAKE